MSTLLLVLVILLIVGALPAVTGHIHQLGWGPSGVGLVIVIVLLVLVMTGRF